MAAKKSGADREVTLGEIKATGACESGINLGGIGTGGVEIWPDGRLHMWNIANNNPWAGQHFDVGAIGAGIMDTDWFLRVAEKGKRPVYRWLFTGNGYALGTASHFWRVHKYFFIKSFPEIRYTAQYPFATLEYVDPQLPVSVEMTAWSGFIPRDDKNSSLPGCYFDFKVKNKTSRQLDISLVWQQQNFAGFDCDSPQHVHEKSVQGPLHAVQMKGCGKAPHHETSGDMSIWARKGKGQKITMLSGNPYMQNVIWPIHQTGSFDGPIMPEHIKYEEMSHDPKNTPDKGWLCVQQVLKAREETAISMGLSWFFPNHRSVKGTIMGHMYENWFKDSLEVAAYMSTNRAMLLRKSRFLPDALLKSTLPATLRLSMLDQLSTITKSSHFIKNGRVGVQEGLGCCSFNTVDVDHYSSYALSMLFPGLRKKILEMHTEMAHPANGKIYHGYPGTVEEVEKGSGADDGYSRWDVCCQYTLQLYRDTKWAGDLDTAKQMYPTAKRAMELIASLDFYGIGLPFIQGGITYDHWNMVGVVGYMAGVYLAALLALEDMALLAGDDDGAAWARVEFERGVRGFEKFLWNGKQYLMFYGRRELGWKPGDDVRGEHKIFEPVKPPQACMPSEPESCGPDCACHREKNYVELQDTGIMTDLLNGNATAAVMGLGAFLDPARVRRQLKLIFDHNVEEDNFCVVNGTYPDGHFLDQWPFMQWQTPWTGTEYFYALMLYTAGMVKEGDHVIDLVFERHVREGMRFDHAECNNHYARPLCIWGAYTARLGLDCDGYRQILSIDPPHNEPYNGALITTQFLGALSFAATKTSTKTAITVLDGSVELKALVVKVLRKAGKASAKLNGKELKVTIEYRGETAAVVFGRKITLRPDSKLEITVN